MKKIITLLLLFCVSFMSAQNILLYTETSGYDHSTREEAETLLSTICTNNGWTFTVDNTGTELDNLSDYDVIWFSNTSGDNFNATERSAIEAFAAAGGHFVSEHASSDSYGHSTSTDVSGNGFGLWDWWAENVTGYSVQNNPNHTSNNVATTVSLINSQPTLVMGLSYPRPEEDEWYHEEKGYVNNSFIELERIASTGGNSYDAARRTTHYIERGDGGRSFYTTQGHNQSTYTSEADFQTLIENGFKYVLENYTAPYANGDGAPTDQLQVRLRFDGNSTDEGGNTVTQPDGSAVTYATSLNGQSAVFDGTQAFQLTDTDLQQETFSMSIILKASADGYSIGAEVGRAGNEAGGINLWSDGDIYFKAEQADLNTGVAAYDLAANSSTWYHFILTYDAATGNWAAYADGSTTAIDSGTQAADAANMDGILTVGGRTDTNNEYLTGEIDMVGVWSKVLTTQEIQEEFDAWASTNDPAENQNQQAPAPASGTELLVYMGGVQVQLSGAKFYTPPAGINEPPTVPASLAVSANNDDSITWTWAASTDNVSVSGYKVSLNDGPDIDVGNVLTYQATSLANGTYYDLKVKAYDGDSNESAFSSNVQGNTTVTLDLLTAANGNTDIINTGAASYSGNSSDDYTGAGATLTNVTASAVSYNILGGTHVHQLVATAGDGTDGIDLTFPVTVTSTVYEYDFVYRMTQGANGKLLIDSGVSHTDLSSTNWAVVSGEFTATGTDPDVRVFADGSTGEIGDTMQWRLIIKEKPAGRKPIWFVGNSQFNTNDQTGTDETVTLPPIIDAGDFVVAGIYKDIVTNVNNPIPTGWSQLGHWGSSGGLVQDAAGAESGDRTAAFFYKIADGTEDGGNITVDFNNNANALMMRASYAFRGVDQTNPVAFRLFDEQGSSPSPVGPAVTSQTYTSGLLVDHILFSESQGINQMGGDGYVFEENTFAGSDGKIVVGITKAPTDDADIAARTNQLGTVGYGWGIVSYMLQGAAGDPNWHPNDDNANPELTQGHAWSMDPAQNADNLPGVWLGSASIASVADTSHGIPGVNYVYSVKNLTDGSGEDIAHLFTNLTGNPGSGDNLTFDFMVKKVSGGYGVLNLNNNTDDYDFDISGDSANPQWIRVTANRVQLTGGTIRFDPNFEDDAGIHEWYILMSVKEN